jgi:HEAT repeat protein
MLTRYAGAVLLLAGWSIPASASRQAVPTPGQFAALGVPARLEVMRSVEKASEHRVTPELVAVISAGLRDRDGGVRRKAAWALNRIFHPASGRARTEAEMAAVRASPDLPGTLVTGVADAVFSVRGASADALFALAPPLDPAARSALVSAYSTEADRMIRNLIVAGLAEVALDAADVRQLVVAALDDEAAAVRRSAARAVARFQPPEALPRIVEELTSGRIDGRDAWSVRDAFVDALAGYGSRAQPHLYVLEALLLAELRPDRQSRLREAIDAIRGAP